MAATKKSQTTVVCQHFAGSPQSPILKWRKGHEWTPRSEPKRIQGGHIVELQGVGELRWALALPNENIWLEEH